MIKIQAEINGAESYFTFNVPEGRTEPAGRYEWVGVSIEFPLEQIFFFEEGGELDFTKIATTLGISTSHEILYERFKEGLDNYRDSVRAGYEPEDEVNENNFEPTPYDPDKIKVRRDTFSVYQIFDMMNNNHSDIDLNPEFQRNFVWDNTRKSLLIESILLGIPIPVLYFAENKTGEYHVVDGMQRLTTIKQFLNNEFPLKNLEYLKECEGMYYSYDDKIRNQIVLSRKYSRRIDQAQLNINIIEATSPAEVKYDIFKRLNTGGRPLNNQEIRNCLSVQYVRNFLRRMASSQEFVDATGNSISDIRMDAQEMVLRFCGFYLERENNEISYLGEMNPFLDQALERLNEKPPSYFIKLEEEFTFSMKTCYYLFEKYCFRKCLSEHLLPGAKKQLINKSLFITWAIEVLNFRNYNFNEKLNQGALADALAKEFDKKGEYYNVITINTSSVKSLSLAFSYANEILKSI